MKNFIWLYLLLLAWRVHGQDSASLSLEEVQQQARAHYPLLPQRQVWEQILRLQLQNTNSAYRPQAELNGQATYQSEVTQVPIKVPGISIPTIAKDQYKATIDIRQLLYDGGMTRDQRALQTAQQQAEQQQIEVELYKVKQQVTQSYFNALLAEAYISTALAAQGDIRQRIEKLEAGVQNGTVLPSNVDLLKAELLKARQQEISARASRQAALDIMGLLMNNAIAGTVKLVMPVLVSASKQQGKEVIQRPELHLYQLKAGILDRQLQLSVNKQRPRVSAFVQGGYGRPGLNMLENQFRGYYMGGIRLNWTLWNWHYDRTEREILRLQQQNITHQQETFTLNTRMQLTQQAAEIGQLQETLVMDKDIIALRSRVKAAAAAQLDNGVITVHDYLTDLNAEIQAGISQRTHEIQLALAHINYQLTKGN